MFKSITNSIQKAKRQFRSAATQFQNFGGPPRVRLPARWSGWTAQAGACFLAGLSAYFACAQCHYTYTTIPNPPGLVHCFAAAINSHGHVAGRVASLSENSRAFIWTPEGGTVQLPMPQGIIDMRATDLNDHDHVVGYMTSTTDWFAFIWDGMDYTIINHPPWANHIEAHAINNAGQVVGMVANVITGPQHAFVWENGTLLDLGPNLSEWQSIASDTNDVGQVVGYALRSFPPAHWESFDWDGDSFDWLTHPDGLDASKAEAASNSGYFAGDGKIEEPTQYFGIVWSPWGTNVIAPPPEFRDARLRDVNDGGRAVGAYDRSISRQTTPIAWQAGITVELAPLVRPEAPPGFWSAQAINRAGQIVGWYSEGTVVLDPHWLPGDLTGDCHVAIDDLALVLSNFGSPFGTFPLGDVDADGEVDLADLAILLAHWGE